jgi:large subunit ribosomal protein L35
MPKMKTHKGTEKRIKVTATGKVKVSSANKGHLLSAKSKSSRRRHKLGSEVSPSDMKRIKQQIANVK